MNRVQELCESRGGRPGLPVPNNPYGLCGRQSTLNLPHYQPRHSRKDVSNHSAWGLCFDKSGFWLDMPVLESGISDGMCVCVCVERERGCVCVWGGGGGEGGMR